MGSNVIPLRPPQTADETMPDFLVCRRWHEFRLPAGRALSLCSGCETPITHPSDPPPARFRICLTCFVACQGDPERFQDRRRPLSASPRRRAASRARSRRRTPPVESDHD